MGDIRIRVGVALDANVKTVYQPLVLAAQQAAQNVMRALNTGAKITVEQQTRTFAQMKPAIGHPYREGAREAGAAITSLREKAKKEADAMTKDVARAAKERVREEAAANREIERELREHNRRQQAELEKAETMRDRLRDRFARRFSHGAVHNGAAAVGMARRLAGDIAHGAGLETNVGSMVHDYTHRQELATALSTEGWIGAWGHPDTAINGSEMKMDPRDIMKRANEIALKTGTNGGATKIMEGMQQFLMKTGNLKQAVDMMEELAFYAKASSTGMDDMLEGASSLSNQLPKTMTEAQKLESIRQTISVLGGQGEVGSLHFRQLAAGGNMAKLAGVANNFTLDESTKGTLEHAGITDRNAQNVAMMGALAQMAMKRGGRDGRTGTLAVNSAKAFIEDLTSKSTAKQWAANFGAGAVYADKEHTQLKDPKALIMAALSKTGGSVDEIMKLMPNKVSRAVVTAYAADYNDARRAAKAQNGKLSNKELDQVGLEAVSKTLDNYLKVAIDKKQLDDKFQEAMSTTQSKVAQVNVRLQMLADTTAEKVLPGMLKLAPLVEDAAGAFSDFILWAGKHPGQAISAAISASIAQAAIGTAIRSALEKAVHEGAKGGVAGGIGAAMTIASLAVTTFYAGKLVIDQAYEKESKRTGDNAVASAQGYGDAQTAISRGSITPEDKLRIENELEALKAKRRDQIANPIGGGWGDRLLQFGFGGGLGYLNPWQKDVDRAKADNAAAQSEALKQNADAIAKLERTLSSIYKGTIKVEVQNHPPAPDGSSQPIPAQVGGGTH